MIFFRASGEAILGTQRYFSMPYSQRSLDLGFQKNLAACEPNERNRLEFKNRNPGKRRTPVDQKASYVHCLGKTIQENKEKTMKNTRERDKKK